MKFKTARQTSKNTSGRIGNAECPSQARVGYTIYDSTARGEYVYTVHVSTVLEKYTLYTFQLFERKVALSGCLTRSHNPCPSRHLVTCMSEYTVHIITILAGEIYSVAVSTVHTKGDLHLQV